MSAPRVAMERDKRRLLSNGHRPDYPEMELPHKFNTVRLAGDFGGKFTW